jgi:hypothetical protein
LIRQVPTKIFPTSCVPHLQLSRVFSLVTRFLSHLLTLLTSTLEKKHQEIPRLCSSWWKRSMSSSCWNVCGGSFVGERVGLRAIRGLVCMFVNPNRFRSEVSRRWCREGGIDPAWNFPIVDRSDREFEIVVFVFIRVRIFQDIAEIFLVANLTP